MLHIKRLKNPALCLLATGLLIASPPTAFAQGEITKHFVFTEHAGFVAGERTTIGASDSQVYPDPLGRYALIRHSDPAPRQDERLAGATDDPSASSLLLYDGRTGRTKTLVRHDLIADRAVILDVRWLNGADAALIVTGEVGDRLTGLMPDGRKPMSTLQLVRPGSTGTAIRTLLESTGFLTLNESPVLPVAVLHDAKQIAGDSGKTDYREEYCTITDRGLIGEPIPLGANSYNASRWTADGATTYFVQQIPANPGLEGAPATKARMQRFSFNVTTRALTPIDQIPAEVETPKPPDPNALKLVSGALLATPPGAAGQQPTAKPAHFAPLWLVRADDKREGRLPTATVIAPDAQKSYLLADDSAVLYIADHTVYVVPLTAQPRPDFDAAYRKILQKQTLANAKSLGLALIGYSQDYNLKFPLAGDMMSAISPYCTNPGVFNNPDTDAPGFTYLLNGQNQAAMGSPATTPMGYLAGPGGRAVVWADGHVTWEDGS